MPVFQTLYDVPSTGLAGASTTMMEVRPGIFYGLSLYANGITEGSVWAVTSSGKLGIIYSAYPPNSTPGSLVQAPDGTVWTDYYEAINGTHTGNYVSMRPDGTDVQNFQTGKLGANGVLTTAAPPDYLYDITAPVLGQTNVFVRIDHNGKFTPLHEFSPTEPRGVKITTPNGLTVP